MSDLTRSCPKCWSLVGIGCRLADPGECHIVLTLEACGSHATASIARRYVRKPRLWRTRRILACLDPRRNP